MSSQLDYVAEGLAWFAEGELKVYKIVKESMPDGIRNCEISKALGLYGGELYAQDHVKYGARLQRGHKGTVVEALLHGLMIKNVVSKEMEGGVPTYKTILGGGDCKNTLPRKRPSKRLKRLRPVFVDDDDDEADCGLVI